MKQVGSHIPYGGKGIASVFKLAKAIEADAVQIYTNNPRSFMPSKISTEELITFRKGLSEARIPVFSHASVMINLANPDPKKQAYAKKAFLAEIKKADLLGCEGVVLHVGAHMGNGIKEGLETFVKNMDEVIGIAQPTCWILLETMGKAGTRMGDHFQDIAWIIKNSRFSDCLGVCMDTVHIFASNYDLREETYWETLNMFDEIIGLDRLKLIHANDSVNDLGKPERHAPIGDGHLGIEVFTKFMNDPRLESIPFVLELAKASLVELGQNIELLRSLEEE